MPSRRPAFCPRRARLGRNIAARRTHLGLTQEQLAEKVGISARHLQSVEAGDYFPAINTLAEFRQALDLTWNALFEGCE